MDKTKEIHGVTALSHNKSSKVFKVQSMYV